MATGLTRLGVAPAEQLTSSMLKLPDSFMFDAMSGPLKLNFTLSITGWADYWIPAMELSLLLELKAWSTFGLDSFLKLGLNLHSELSFLGTFLSVLLFNSRFMIKLWL